jgi:hypothetical protein
VTDEGAASARSGARRRTSGERSRAPLPREGPEGEAAVADRPHLSEPRHPVDVDHDRRAREPHVHERDQALAAGQHLRLRAVAGQQVERLVERAGRVVLERRRLHNPQPPLTWMLVPVT